MTASLSDLGQSSSVSKGTCQCSNLPSGGTASTAAFDVVRLEFAFTGEGVLFDLSFCGARQQPPARSASVASSLHLQIAFFWQASQPSDSRSESSTLFKALIKYVQVHHRVSARVFQKWDQGSHFERYEPRVTCEARSRRQNYCIRIDAGARTSACSSLTLTYPHGSDQTYWLAIAGGQVEKATRLLSIVIQRRPHCSATYSGGPTIRRLDLKQGRQGRSS